MITNKELNAVKLSPTKKDFYQIWNELLEVAGKLSERWDPTSTNESDPGIVLLKVLTAIADKLNYNIDINTLEAFMPSAAQEESMRKLTDMMGYSMKYYQSATTEVKISYNKNYTDPITESAGLTIDKFTNIKDIDDSINYVTLEEVLLNRDNPSKNVECIEGELVECETDDNNIVSLFHLDDNYRYFLPEIQIAENGIFVTNIAGQTSGQDWKKVSNLNSQSLGSKVFKFGVDAQEGLPYIQFPEDISTIIEDGLKIKYIRTSGVGGNISLNTLSKMEAPLSWSQKSADEKSDKGWYDVANFTVSNVRAATNGTNREGLNKAYNNFKKTIGTFDTLVTCRDYMNSIYQMVSASDSTTPLVSNIIVSDIRDDINRAVTLGTFTHRGVEYKAMAKYAATGDNSDKHITHFDLMIYPFNTIYGLNNKTEFQKSFKYDTNNLPEILLNLEESKTLAHNFVSPKQTEVACIKNYYKLRAKINTIRKVGVIEQASILSNVYSKLFENFNMRQLDFGEEIPYDTLLSVMESADNRIKNVSLDEPEITTKFWTVDNQPHTLTGYGTDNTTNSGKKIYNSLVLNNVLAGRVPLFNYNENFKPDFTEKAYPGYNANYGKADSNTQANQLIYKIKTEFNIPKEITASGSTPLELLDNEVVQFRAPSLKTTTTYPAYVHYYLHLEGNNSFTAAIPATMQTLRNFLQGGPHATGENVTAALEHYANLMTGTSLIKSITENEELRTKEADFKAAFDNVISESIAIFKKVTENEIDSYVRVASSTDAWNLVQSNNSIQFYTFDLSKTTTGITISNWVTWLKSLTTFRLDTTDTSFNASTNSTVGTATTPRTIPTVYTQYEVNIKQVVGKYVDENHVVYKELSAIKSISTNPFDYYFVPRIWSATNTTNSSGGGAVYHTLDGLGQDTVGYKLEENSEYKLKENEYLLINYTKSDENNSKKKIVVNDILPWDRRDEQGNIVGTIIKANFAIEDSEDHRNRNYSFTKNSGYSFAGYSIPGMFTLGANEQIEIRDVAQVSLDWTVANLYWKLQDEKATNGTRIDFPFDEKLVYKSNGTTVPANTAFNADTMIYLAYTLKEGEYLFYTDMNKSDIAFYGSGTTIERQVSTQSIYKYTSDTNISAEDIIYAGLKADIPWRPYNFSGNNAKLILRENQYINLTKGDLLNRIDFKTESDRKDLSSEYVAIKTAKYETATTNAETSLPPLNIDGYSWEARSKLDLALSPAKAQTLHKRVIAVGAVDSATNYTVTDSIKLLNNTGTNILGGDAVITPSNETAPLSIKANKIVQSAVPLTDVTYVSTTEDNIVEDIIADLQLKIFAQEDLQSVEGTNTAGRTLNTNNFGDGTFTAVNFKERLERTYSEEETEPDISFKLNALLPTGNFGIIMVYYQNLSNGTKTATNNAKITADSNCLTKFNSGATAANNITLSDGINIIQITNSTTLTISSNGNNEAAVIFSSLDFVPNTNPINPKLCYKVTDTAGTGSATTGYEQILKDIKTIDTNNEFYYNIPIAGNIDIDMNPNDETDTLENPLNWFSYNNINNKFVIAELDADTFIDGITIAKSSRSNF